MTNISIGLFQGIALYIATVLGSGVLFLSGVTASIAGPASILSWMIVIIISFPLAYSFACLAQEYPDAGGAATFVRISFGEHLGNIIGWLYFVTAAVGQTIVALTGSYYLGNAFGFSQTEIMVSALLMLFIAGATNYYGIRVSGKVALLLSGCLFFLLVITIFLSLPSVSLNQFTPFFPHGSGSIGSAITVIFWAFFGWEAICNLSNNFRNPDKNIVRSTIISAIIIGFLFLALSFITIGTGTYGNEESNLSPIAVIMNDTVGLNAQLITGMLAFIICTGTINAFVASLTQLGFSLSRDRAFPSYFSVLHPKIQISRRMVIFVVMFAGAGVCITEALSLTFNDILFIPTSLGILVYILSMAAGVKLFKNGTLPWLSSLIAFILCVLVLPFFQSHIIVPLIVISIYLIYMYIFHRRR
ncbi:APC family permease [Alteribacillus bidgolensis]|uniref:Amino acid/polyamine/organocation transporter, APC superfamily n=1 Tax=Alteribacillus bidgolensis TaxID=930129 RepID=A0A1G8FW13_9BACI|nr:amino acid permease [Alteribacillus bidgolensis]SDH86265.1 amino acid/polyamine/organocation transporter, APC superfamily [Alteribacillus bidgolensis]